MPQNDNNHHFVSRGGIKLQAAIENWKLKTCSERSRGIENSVVLDVGSSTGGFVDCLLQNGAKKVYAVDTCYGELAWKLRNDPRVVVMERTNILHLQTLPFSVIARSEATIHETERGEATKQSRKEIARLAESAKRATLPLVARNDNARVDLVTIDAGWTKLELVLPVVKKFLKPDGFIIALLKPHYEADKRDLVKGVLPEDVAMQVKDQVLDRVQGLGYRVEKIMESPILGRAGNLEYLLYLTIK